jgi:hypothetical protein
VSNATAHLIPGPFKVALVGRTEDRYTLRELRSALEAHGFVVCTRWIDLDSVDVAEVAAAQAHLARRMEDILCAHVVLVYSERVTHRTGTGERHAELMLAIAANKPIVLVGWPENVYQCHAAVQRIPPSVNAARLAEYLTLAAVHGTPIAEVAMAP